MKARLQKRIAPHFPWADGARRLRAIGAIIMTAAIVLSTGCTSTRTIAVDWDEQTVVVLNRHASGVDSVVTTDGTVYAVAGQFSATSAGAEFIDFSTGSRVRTPSDEVRHVTVSRLSHAKGAVYGMAFGAAAGGAIGALTALACRKGSACAEDRSRVALRRGLKGGLRLGLVFAIVGAVYGERERRVYRIRPIQVTDIGPGSLGLRVAF